jgi:hypothetical protein
MGLAPAAEPVAFHDPGKSTAFGKPRHIDLFADRKKIAADSLPQLELFGFFGRKFPQDPEALPPRLLEMPLQRLVRAALALLVKGQLERVISIGGFGFDLGYYTGARLDHRDRHKIAFGIEDARHPNLFP